MLYAEVSYFYLGTQYENFSTFSDALETWLKVLLGEIALEGFDGLISSLIYWSFIVFGFIIMLNTLLAIIIEAFLRVRLAAASLSFVCA